MQSSSLACESGCVSARRRGSGRRALSFLSSRFTLGAASPPWNSKEEKEHSSLSLHSSSDLLIGSKQKMSPG